MYDLVFTFLRQYPHVTVALVLLMALRPAQEIGLPVLYGHVITALQRTTDRGRMTATVAVAVVATAGVYAASVVRDAIHDWLQPALQCFLRAELMQRIVGGGTHGGSLSTAETVYILDTAPDLIGVWFRYCADYLVPYVGTLVVAAVVFLRFDVPLGGAFIALVGVLFVVFFYHAPQDCMGHAGAHAQRMGDLRDHIEDVVRNLEAVLSNRHTTDEAIRTMGDHAHHFDAYGRTARCARGHRAVLLVCNLALLAVAFARCAHLVSTGRRPPERCVAMLLVVLSVANGLMWFADAINADVLDVGRLVWCERLLRQSDDEHRWQQQHRRRRRHPPGTRAAPPAADESPLGLVDVTFAYRRLVTAAGGAPVLLRDFTLVVRRGERLALTGPVGCGKTTVLRLLLGMYTPDRGDAYFQGKWYTDWDSLWSIRRCLGYVPQQPVLRDQTLLENALYGHAHPDDADVRRRATDLLREMGFAEDRLHRRVGKGGATLSGGQRQLVWCVRVFLQDPEVVLMDEPTASLDDDATTNLLDILDRLMVGRTVVFVSHDARLLKRATRTVVMPGGATSSTTTTTT